MRKFALAILGLIVLLISLAGIWLQFPQLSHPELVKEVNELALQRFKQRQEKARDPEFNGYLHPRFVEFWGSHQTAKKGGKTEKSVYRWKDFSSAAYGELQPHRTQLEEQDPEYLEARTDFEQLLPELYDALKKPVLLAPEERFDMLAFENINIIAVRGLAHALAGLGESYVAAGEPERAIRPFLGCLQLGKHLEEQGSMVACMGAIIAYRAGLDATVGLLQPSAPLSTADWTTLKTTTQRTLPKKDLIARILEDEIARALRTFEIIGKSKTARVNFTGGGLLFELPGMLEREERIYLNQTAQLLLALREKRRPPSTSPAHSLGAWLQGTAGVLSDGLSLTYDRPILLVTYTRRELEALTVCAALLSYRSDKGEFPDTLGLLDLGSICDDLEWDKQSAVLFLPLQETLPKKLKNIYTNSPWIAWDGNGFRCRLK